MLNRQQQKSILQYQYENLSKCIYQIENEIKNLEAKDKIDIEFIASYSVPKEYIELCNSLSIYFPIFSSTSSSTTNLNNKILQSSSLVNHLTIQQQQILNNNNNNNQTLQQPVIETTSIISATSLLNNNNNNTNVILSNSYPNNEEIKATISTSVSNSNMLNNNNEKNNLNENNQIILPENNNDKIIEDVRIKTIIDNNSYTNQFSIINNIEKNVSINDNQLSSSIKDENLKENKKKKDKDEKNNITSINFDHIVKTSDHPPVVQSINDFKTYSRKFKLEIINSSGTNQINNESDEDFIMKDGIDNNNLIDLNDINILSKDDNKESKSIETINISPHESPVTKKRKTSDIAVSSQEIEEYRNLNKKNKIDKNNLDKKVEDDIEIKEVQIEDKKDESKIKKAIHLLLLLVL